MTCANPHRAVYLPYHPKSNNMKPPSKFTPAELHRQLRKSAAAHQHAPLQPDTSPTPLLRASSSSELIEKLIEIEKVRDKSRYTPVSQHPRLKRRCTVVLSTEDLLRLMHVMSPSETPSEWIRKVIKKELDMLDLLDMLDPLDV